MKTKVVFLTCLLLIGCNGKPKENAAVAGSTQVAAAEPPKKTMLQRLGFGGPTPEEIAAQKELEAKQRQEQQEQIKAQHEQQAQQLKDGDEMVAKWATMVQEKATKDGFGFEKTEGLTETDPWGQQIKVSYHQKWFNEIATIQSAGPDGLFGSEDDLTRVRTAKNPAGILEGISSVGWVVIVWLLCGGMALAFSSGIGYRRVAKGKSKSHRRPVVFAVATILFAPLAVLIYGLQFIGGAMGASGEFFDGFDFDFDIDL